MEKFGRIALKTLLWIIGSVIFLIVLVLVLIQVPAVQNFAKNKAVNFLQGKIKTKVKIDRLSIEFPKMLVLEGVYFADQKADTLLAADTLKVNIAMLQLLHKKVAISDIELAGITANVSRTPDSVFNFTYIMNAFMSGQKTEPKPDDTTSALKFFLDKVQLDRINIKYKDAITGNDLKFVLNHFDTRITDFDLDKMKFTIPKITLSGFYARVIQKPAGPVAAALPPPATAAKPMDLDLTLGTIDLSKINVDYETDEMKTSLNLGTLLVEMDKIDLKKQRVGIKNIQLENTKAWLALAKPKTVAKAVTKVIKKADSIVASPQSSMGWSLALNKITFVNDNVKFDNDAQKALPKGIDYMHMDIRNLNAGAQDIAYSPAQISGRISTFTFQEKSGLNIRKFHTTFLYGEKQSYLNALYLETPYTVLQDQVQIGYQSMDDMMKHLGELRINANLNGSKLGLRDVLIFMPSMASMEPFKSSPNDVFKINARVNGQVNNLRIPNLEVTGLSSTHIKASATLKGLPDMNKAFFDVKLDDFNTSSTDIAKLAPKGTIPSSVSVPPVINVKGTFKGGMKDFNTNLNMHSSYGNASVIAAVKMGKGKGAIAYNADLKADNLNVGKLAKMEGTVGLLTLSAKIKGSGTDLKTAAAQFSGNIASANVKGYTYHSLVLSGSANRGIISTAATMKDPNISFEMNAKVNMVPKYPAVNLTLNVDSVNLKNLKFATGDLRFHGKLVANVPTAAPDYLNGNISLTDIQVVNSGQSIQLDSVNIIATANADSSTLRLKTDMLSAHLAGKYKLTEIGTAMQYLIAKYYNTSPANAPKVKYSPEQFTFSARLIKTPLFTKFVPDLKTLDPVNFTGSFDSQAGKLIVNASAPNVVYGTNTVTNLKMAINTDNALNYSITADNIKASQVNLLYPSISGNAQNNKLATTIQIRDKTKKERYRIAGVLSANAGEYQFSFLPDGLFLDYTQWTVGNGNALEFGSKGIKATNFSLSNTDQTLSVVTTPPQYNGPLMVSFKNFRIGTITKMAEQSSLLVGGVINGNATITNLDKSAQFTSDITIGDFNFKGDTVGNIALKVNNQTPNAFAANIGITGKGNQVNLDGFYYTDKSSFDMDLNIVNLNLKSIEGFTFGAMKQATGSINSKLKITGTTSAPQVRGDINFNNAGFNIAMINSYYKMPNETITFNDDGILFKDFTLIDSAGSKAIVTGTIYTKTYQDYRFGIDINATNFRVYNASQADSKLYYGQAYIDTHLKIRGDMNKPIVDGDLKVNDKTNMTIVLPQTDPGVEDRKGVVEFVNKKETKRNIAIKGQLDSLKRSALTGLDVSLNLIVEDNAAFTIVVDEANGDIVHIKGNAQLNLGIDPSGKTNLTGTYTVNSGSYDLSYLTINRKFLFKKGSTITWQGDPTLATLDLTAIYIANVAPIDLVSDQITDATTATMYKQPLPFNVDLTLKNQLLKPDITFAITLPQDTTYNVTTDVLNTVNSKLDQLRQDPNELNKQVFAVLLLNHFIGDNPLQSQAGGAGLDGEIRSSVSSLLTDQLNKLAGNMIAGVSLNFNLTSGQNYASGTATNQTDLNVGLSKQFLNDRLTVSVGNDFNLEGQQANQNATNIAGDVSVGYKLTKDGKYMLRAYRRDQYIVIQGQVVETGVGFSLTVDYNHFSQIFQGKTKEEKALIKKQKEDEKEKKEKAKEAEDQPKQTATN